MSRPVNISDSLTFTPAAWVSGSYASISGQTAPVGQGSNGTNYAQVNLTTGRNATTEAIWSFDCSSIPDGSTITSVTCSTKCLINNTTTNRITTRQARLYSGTTAKGSAYTVTNSTTAFNITCGTWTRAELQNARIRLYAVRGTNNTSSSYYFRFYGATLTVNYSVSGTEYEVSFTNTSDSVTTQPSITQYVFQNGSQEISFYNIRSLDNVEITDNGNDIKNQLVHSTNGTRSVTLIPSSLSGNSGTVTNPNNGLSDTSSTTFAEIPGDSSNYMEYSFDISSIPASATINSILCSVKAAHTRTYLAAGSAQLYAGLTAKGSAYTFGSTATVFDLTTDTWTISELQTLKLRIGSTYTGTSTYYTRFYGATLTINYTIAEDTYMYTIFNIRADHVITINDVSFGVLPIRVKQNGEWVTASKLFVKQNGSWIQSTTIKVKNNGTWK